jgi:hypothetical protein
MSWRRLFSRNDEVEKKFMTTTPDDAPRIHRVSGLVVRHPRGGHHQVPPPQTCCPLSPLLRQNKLERLSLSILFSGDSNVRKHGICGAL